MSNPLKHLPELVQADVISPEIADRIADYYKAKEPGGNRLMLIFSVLGSFLIGLGIILIIAHNWDDLSKPVKLSLVLSSLLLGQILCGLALLRKWSSGSREAVSIFLMMSVAASISIVSQVYNIPGSLGSFLLTWMLLSIPIVYVMRSNVTSLLVIVGLTWYGCELGYFTYPDDNTALYYWPMLLALLPFYLYLLKQAGKNFHAVHAWFFVSSLTITLGMFAHNNDSLMFVAYTSMFSLFILVFQILETENIPGANAFLVAGSAGITIILLVFSFEFAWKELTDYDGRSAELMVSGIISLIAAGLLVNSLLKKGLAAQHPLSFVFLIFIPLFVIGNTYFVAGQIGANLCVLIIAMVTTKRGADRNNLIILNYGLTIMAALVVCRFFDTKITFAIRGMLFIAVGATFFLANYYAIRKRRSLEL
jgi:uncharacterized membrane protein